MIGRLYATHYGRAQCVLDAAPNRIRIHEVLRYAGRAWIIEGADAGSEAALFRSGEPTF